MEVENSINENIKYFKKDHRITTLLKDLEVNLVKCNNRVEIIQKFASEYDYEEIKVNGYRTSIDIYVAAVAKIGANLNNLKIKRSSFFFKIESFIRYKILKVKVISDSYCEFLF